MSVAELHDIGITTAARWLVHGGDSRIKQRLRRFTEGKREDGIRSCYVAANTVTSLRHRDLASMQKILPTRPGRPAAYRG